MHITANWCRCVRVSAQMSSDEWQPSPATNQAPPMESVGRRGRVAWICSMRERLSASRIRDELSSSTGSSHPHAGLPVEGTAAAVHLNGVNLSKCRALCESLTRRPTFSIIRRCTQVCLDPPPPRLDPSVAIEGTLGQALRRHHSETGAELFKAHAERPFCSKLIKGT